MVIDRDLYGPGLHRRHPGMLDLVEQRGLQLRLCRPYRAKTKGKVERFNGCLQRSFLVPLKAAGLTVDLDTAKHEMLRWLAGSPIGVCTRPPASSRIADSQRTGCG